MCFLPAIPPLLASAAAATSSSLATTGAAIGGTGATAATGATTGASIGSVLAGTAAATSILGTALSLANQPKMPGKPPTPTAPTMTGAMTPANQSMAAVAPGSILGGTFTSPSASSASGFAASSGQYGKSVLGG